MQNSPMKNLQQRKAEASAFGKLVSKTKELMEKSKKDAKKQVVIDEKSSQPEVRDYPSSNSEDDEVN